jgi:hemerythrin-like domain-containing protein
MVFMNFIERLVYEHKNVKRMLLVIRAVCLGILNGDATDYEDFYKIIDFIRNYTDKHHHGKEEAMLFARMIEEMGPLAEKIIKHGMLVEHDFGRLYVKDLEDSVNRVLNGDLEARLDVIANAVSYTHLLCRHIDKEDDVIYKYAEKNLAQETINQLEQECAIFDEKAAQANTESRYLELLRIMERKYVKVDKI